MSSNYHDECHSYEAAEAGVCCRRAIEERVLPVRLKPAHDASAASAQRGGRVPLINTADV